MPRGRRNNLLSFANVIEFIFTRLFEVVFRRRSHHPLRQVVNRAARKEFGQLLRHLASGRITNDEFEDASYSITFKLARVGEEDVAIDELFIWAWSFYNDTEEHRLTGKMRLSRSERRYFAQAYLFLQTDLPYEGIRRGGFLNYDWDMPDWPFAWRPDFKQVCANPRLLSGIISRPVAT